MFCGCGRFRFVVRVIYGTAVFIKSDFRGTAWETRGTIEATAAMFYPSDDVLSEG